MELLRRRQLRQLISGIGAIGGLTLAGERAARSSAGRSFILSAITSRIGRASCLLSPDCKGEGPDCSASCKSHCSTVRPRACAFSAASLWGDSSSIFEYQCHEHPPVTPPE